MGIIKLNGIDYPDNGGGGSGGGGHTIVDQDGTSMPQENKLQFTGAVSVTDDSVNGQTVVDVEGGGNYYLNTIYSTEEKKIGYWTDGKPLYQKTWDFGSDLVIPNNAFYTTNIDASAIETIVEGFGIYSTGATRYDLMVNTNGTNIRLQSDRTNGSANVRFFVMSYTKTTDTPELNPQTGGVIYLPSIYSAEEREIGCWTDGKPLYQKTWLVPKSSLNSGETTYTHNNGLNIDTLVSVEGAVANSRPLVEYHSSSTWACSIYNIGNNAFWIYLGSNVYSNMAATSYVKVTLRYTKTTDTVGSGTWTPSGAKAVHYSTNEHVIGTWIDGKPIYEITVDTGTLPNNTTKTIAHGISDLKAVIELRGYALNTNNGINIPIPYIYKSGSSTKCLQVYVDGTNINLVSMENLSGYTESYVTLQYTKTTD